MDFDPQPDFVKVAEAQGCYGQRILRSGEVRGALENAAKANRDNIPAVLDFVVDTFDHYPGFKEFHGLLTGC